MGTINLSDELLSEIQGVLEKHDAANQEMGISVQYMAAVLGYMVGQFPGGLAKQQQILEQLAQLAQHVLSENQPRQPPGDDAFGIWKPE